MGSPVATPTVVVPARTLPPRQVLSAMALGLVHDLDDVMKGFKPYGAGERPLPEGVSETHLLVSFAMQVHACLTHKATEKEDGSNEAPARFGDVLLSSRERSVPKRWRRVRSLIRALLDHDGWPLLEDEPTFKTPGAVRFVTDVIDLMAVCRQTYLVEAAEETVKMTPERRRALRQAPREADQARWIAGLPEAKRKAVMASMVAGATFEDAMKALADAEEGVS